jgi:hypothetical protein
LGEGMAETPGSQNPSVPRSPLDGAPYATPRLIDVCVSTWIRCVSASMS